MPPKRNAAKTARNEGSDSDTDHNTDHEMDRTVVSSPNVTMSEEMLQNLVSSITRSQVEASRVLIESILSSNRATSSPRLDAPGHAQRSGNFAKCTARFDGRSKNADELEAFIDAIEVFRECTNISDEHALRGLPMLLVGEAAVWWQGVKASVSSWTEALQRLRGMFGVPRPGYKIFRDIFASEQNSERADVFVCKVRALIMKLPYTVPEEMKLDIIFGLLDRRIRKRVSRDAVDGLEQLINKVRLVEESLAEVTSLSNNNSASPVNPSTARRHSNAGPSVNPSRTVDDPPSISKTNETSGHESSIINPRTSVLKCTNSDEKRRPRPKCSYCKVFGHTIDVCRNKENKVNTDSQNSRDSNILRCYGCGQLGVVRSKCDNCNSVPISSSKPDFSTAHVIDGDDPRPLVEIKVVSRTGVAILDTGATHSIASPTLYNLLRDAGIKFRTSVRTIGLADGSQQTRTILEGDVDITLQGRTIPTTFLVLPDAQTRTLLGRDFITRASILLDLPQNSWCYNDGPRRTWHPFITSFELSTTSKVELTKVEVKAVVFGKNKGPKVTKRTSPTSKRLRAANPKLPFPETGCSSWYPGAFIMQGEGPYQRPDARCRSYFTDKGEHDSGFVKVNLPSRCRCISGETIRCSV